MEFSKVVRVQPKKIFKFKFSIFKFIWICVDGEIIENDTKTIVWTENILSVFGAKTPFSNLSGLVWTGPYCVFLRKLKVVCLE